MKTALNRAMDIEIGCVRSVNPARRELRIAPAPGYERAVGDGQWVSVILRDETQMRCRVATARAYAARTILTLAPGVTRDAVARMKGGRVLVGEDALPTDAGPWGSVAGSEGWTVVAESGRVLGTVVERYWTGAHEVIEVAREDGKTLRLPLIEQVVSAVAVDQGRLVVGDLAPYAVEDED